MPDMAKSDRPPLHPLGPTLQLVRKELDVTQQEAAEAIGLKGGQSSMSPREMHPEHPRAIEPRPDEIVRFEDRYGLQRGTVLRRAGYVVDALDPLDSIDGWTFLNATERGIVRHIVNEALARSQRADRPDRSS